MILNYATDPTHPILGFATSWLEEFARRCEALDVISHRVGGWPDRPRNVYVSSLADSPAASVGIASIPRLYRLIRSARGRGAQVCFVHMSHKLLAAAGPYLRYLGIPTVLWYAHGAVPPSLRIAARFADRVVTPTPSSFRLDHRRFRVVVTGHGVPDSQFYPRDSALTEGPEAEWSAALSLLSVGRLTKSKGLGRILAVAENLDAELGDRWIWNIIGGPVGSGAHIFQDVQAEARARFGARIRFLGDLHYSEIGHVYRSADVFLHMSATGSLDKVVLEALLSGLPVLSDNESLLAVIEPSAATEFLVAEFERDAPRRLAEWTRNPRKDLAAIVAGSRKRVLEGHSLRGVVGRILRECASLRAEAGR